MSFGMSPPPVPPADFSGLTDEELRAMEGEERENLEARVQCLRNIHTLLDAAMLQIQQYTTVVSRMGGLDTASTSTVWSAERPTASAMSSKSSNIATSNSSDPMMAAPNPVDTSNKPDDSEVLEGAVGYTVPTETVLPSGESGAAQQDSEDSSELGEIRRRRLEKFSNKMQEQAKTDNNGGTPD